MIMYKLWIPTNTGHIVSTALKTDRHWITMTTNEKNNTTTIRSIQNPTPSELMNSIKEFLTEVD